MKVGVIIQARVGSTRLPQKVMKEVEGKKILEHVVERVSNSTKIACVIVATTVEAQDDPIAELAIEKGWLLSRGSEDDVLSRYYFAALEYELDVIVRITSDCPLIDWQLIDTMIEVYKAHNYDLVTNAGNEKYRTFPRGMDTEIFSFNVLKEAFESAVETYQREHVTPYIYESGRVYYYQSEVDYSAYRLTLDTPEDFQLIEKIYKTLYHGEHDFLLVDILKVLNEYPDLTEINKSVEQKPLIEKGPKLRLAGWSDCDFLYHLVNDPVVRENSFSSDEIKYEDHQKWLKSKLDSTLTEIYICEFDGKKAGQIRLDIDNVEKRAKISFSVMNSLRGKGLGSFMLEAVKGKVKMDYMLYGEVKKNNSPSQKAFLKAGYNELNMKDHYIYQWKQ